MEDILTKKMVFFGEVHSIEKIIELQKVIQANMISQAGTKLNVIMEHFSFEMQHLLDGF